MALLFHWAKPKSDELISAAYMQVAMQMGPGAGYPGGPAPPNFFNLPPGGGMYPSMDPSQAGTRAQRQDGSEAGLFVLLWPSCTNSACQTVPASEGECGPDKTVSKLQLLVFRSDTHIACLVTHPRSRRYASGILYF